MTDAANAAVPARQARPAEPQTAVQRQRWYRLLSLLFGGPAVTESVTTQVHFEARPGAVWERLMFYEEVPGRPPWHLRLFLPSPVGTEGRKDALGAVVHCAYARGDLYKRIVAVDAPRSVRFDVVRQELGIEDCVVTLGGSYRIAGRGEGCEVSLTTNYQTRLRPRRLWYPVEKFVARRLHRHILDGMNAALSLGISPAPPVGASGQQPEIPTGDLACTPSPSRSRR